MRRKLPVLLAILTTLVAIGSGCSAPRQTHGGPSTGGAGPVAPAGFVKLLSIHESGVIPGAKSLPATAVLGGPHFQVFVSQVAVVDHIDADWLLNVSLDKAIEPLRAAPGQELLIVGLAEISKNGEYRIVGPWTHVEASVVVAGTPHTLAYPQAEAILVVAAPKGAPVQLTVKDLGWAQSIDLRTGAPGPGAVLEYTRPPLHGEASYNVPVMPSPRYFPILNAEVEISAIVEPGKEWWKASGPGRLSMQVKVRLFGYEEIAGELDLTASLRVRAGGRQLTVSGGSATIKPDTVIPYYVASGIIEATIPTGLTSITVSFSPKGQLTYDGSRLTYRTSGPTSTTLKLAR